MSRLTLSLACGNYDRMRALADGTVKPEGIDLIYLDLPVEEIFWRLVHHQEFDVSEMSLSSYMIAKARDLIDYTAIPVFPSRFFRHSCVFINKHSGITEPSDLKGKKIGVPEYQMTAALWIRGFLMHDYQVMPHEVEWYVGGLEESGRVEKIDLDLDPNISIQPIPEDNTLNEMIDSGEIDALITARAPSSFLAGSPNVVRLFPNYDEVEKEYYRRTKIFPIMHLVVVRNEILKQHPWVAGNLLKAFELSKKMIFSEYNQTAALKTTIPFQVKTIEETIELMGEDYWPYGIEPNRKTLETAIDYSYEQGMIKRKLTIEELFVSSTFDQYKI